MDARDGSASTLIGTPLLGKGPETKEHRLLSDNAGNLLANLAAMAGSAADVAAPAANVAAIVQYGPRAAARHVISGLVVSYSGGAPAGGNVQILDGPGNVVFSADITAQGPTVVPLPTAIIGSVNQAMTVILTAGGASVLGKVSVIGHYVSQADVPASNPQALDFSQASNSMYLPMLI